MVKSKRREKGTGTIQKMADGRYRAFIRYGSKPNGQPYSKSFTCKTELEAQQKLKAFAKSLKENGNIKPTHQSLETYMTDWLTNTKKNELKPSSYDRLECTLVNNVFPYLGRLQIQTVTPKDIQSCLNTLSDKGLSYSTVKKTYDALNSCYKFAISTRALNFNPVTGVTIPGRTEQKIKTKKQKEIKYFTPDEQRKLIEIALEKYPTGTPVCRYGYVVPFLLNTGLRLGELLALQWNRDVDFENRIIHISHSIVHVKNRNENVEVNYKLLEQDSVKSISGERSLYLNDAALNALKNLKELNPEGKYVLQTKNGKFLNPSNIERLVKNVCKRANLESGKVFSPHALRHTFASNLIWKGVNIKIISELLGHSDVSITMNVYAHLLAEQKKEAIFKIDNII